MPSLWLQAQEYKLNKGFLLVSDSLLAKSGVHYKLDSISILPDHYLTQIDSLLQAKTQLLQLRINDLTTKATGKIPSQDSLSNSGAAGLLEAELDELTPEQYTTQLTEINQSLETYQSQITDQEELKWIDHYSGQLDQLEGVVSKYQGKLLNLDELQALKGYHQQLEQLSGEASGYFEELQNIVMGGLTDESLLMQQLESKIGHYSEFQQLQKVTAELERVKNMPQDQQEQLKSYQDKDKLKSQAMELVNKHFSEHQDKLQTAQQKLASFKKKYSAVQTTKDMSTAVKRNSLEGKPLSERLVLGGNFQINPSFTKSPSSIANGNSGNSSTSKVPTSVDISPLLGYRLNKKLMLGVGGTYRAILEIDNFEAKNQVFGYRGFIQQDAIKGFFIHGEYENLNMASNTINTSDQVSRSWHPGGLAGIGKQFSFYKQIKGQVMVLYDFLHEDGESPYHKPWVIRFGFNIQGLQSKESANSKVKNSLKKQ